MDTETLVVGIIIAVLAVIACAAIAWFIMGAGR
jgi:hypothetical protein